MATDQPHLATFTVALEDLQVDARAFGPLKSVRCFIKAQTFHGLAGDLDDPIATDDSCFPGRAAADHADQPQPFRIVLELDSQADEVAVDHGIQVFELVRREIAGKVIKGIARAASELK